MNRRLQLYRSHRVEDLVAAFVSVGPPSDDPFEPEVVVIQSRGMGQWLQMKVAEARSVAANLRFVSPEELAREAMHALGMTGGEGEGRAGEDPWSPGRLVWHVMSELGAGGAGLPEVDEFLDASGVDRDRRRAQLADRVAETFYRYALYRPALVESWQRGEEEGDWQAALWRRLTARISAASPNQRLVALRRMLEAGEPVPPGLPRRVSLVGINTLPPALADVFAALGRRVEVHAYLMTPGATLDAVHPLRASFDRLGRDLEELLIERGAEVVELSSTPPSGGVLQELQRSIVTGAVVATARAPEERRQVSTLDRSLRVHVCHTPQRQVEALRDQLLELFCADETLQPRDVLVMTPDLDTYAPLIDAVFRDGDTRLATPQGERRGFPALHQTHDLSLRRENPVAEALLTVLDLAGSRLTASDMLGLLTRPVVRAAAGLEESLDAVRGWIRAAQVRWGRDAAHRSAVGQPEDPGFTWRFGFDRLLLGHALADRFPEGYAGVAPVDDIEGQESEVLGRFIDWAERLFEHLDALSANDTRVLAAGDADAGVAPPGIDAASPASSRLGLDAATSRPPGCHSRRGHLAQLRDPRTLSAWAETLDALLTDLLLPRGRRDGHTDGRAGIVRRELASLVSRAAAAGFDEALSLQTLRGLLERPFSARRPSISFLSGGLTFCTMVPMRNIPFRIIALLGMDEGAYPRQPHGLAFDRIDAGERQIGDRSARDDDRTVFLETLLAARDHLIVTYTGRGATDNALREPAGPVAELLDALARGWSTSQAAAGLGAPVVVDHPLEPFSEQAFGVSVDGSSTAPLSFDLRLRDAARNRRAGASAAAPLIGGPLPPLDPPIESVALGDLVRFYQCPTSWFLRERLKLGFPRAEDGLEDREAISLDGLGKYGVRAALLSWELDGRTPADPKAAARARGLLPPGALGDAPFHELRAQAQDLAAEIEELRAGPARRVRVDSRVGGLPLTGVVGDVYGDHRVTALSGSVRAKHLFGHWIRHLALELAEPSRAHQTTVVGHGGSCSFAPVGADKAAQRLAELVEGFVDGHDRPLPFFPETSQARAAGDWREVERAWSGQAFSEGNTPSVAAVYAALPDDDPEFAALAERFWSPALALSRKGGGA